MVLHYLLSQFYFIVTDNGNAVYLSGTVDSAMVILTSLNWNNCLSGSENLVPILTWKSKNR